jgi:hypothetical protein
MPGSFVINRACFFFFIAAVYFMLSATGFSQGFIHYNQGNGLPSNKVYMITLDSYGFIWCTTDKGIAMFNGEKFTTYTVEDGLPINDLWKIYPTKDGKMWYFGRSNRLGYIENGRVCSFPSNDKSVMNPTSFSFYGNKIGIVSSEISYYLSNNEWRKEVLSVKNVNRLRDLAKLRGAIFWFGNIEWDKVIIVGENRLAHLDAKLNVIADLYIDGPPVIHNRYSPTAIFTQEGMFYFHVWDRLCIYNQQKKSVHTILLNKYFKEEDIKLMYPFYENNTLIMNGPAGKFELKDDSLVQIIQPVSIEGNVIRGLFLDSLKNTWVNTFNNGIFMYPNNNNSLQIFPGENVQKVYFLNGYLYAGIENNGLYKIGLNTVEKLPTKGKHFYEIAHTRDSNLSIVTNAEIGSFIRERFMPMVFRDSFYHAELGRNVLAFSYNVKCYFKSEGAEYFATSTVFFKRSASLKEGFGFSGVYHVISYQHKIILGTTTGLKLFQNHRILDIPRAGPHQVNKLFLFKEYLLVGTEGGGLLAYNDTLMNVKGTENFVINNIDQSNDSTLWISTNLGVHEIVYTKGDFTMKRSVLKSNGLTSNIVNDLVVRNDSLFCATENGLCMISLKGLKLNNTPNIIFTNVSINDSIFNARDTIAVMSANRNVLQISYDIAYLNEHQQLKSYYKIEPVSKEWIPIHSGSFTLNGLKPGNYVVKVKTEGFNHNMDEESIYIVIRPRWYERTGFIIIAGILALGLLFTIGFFMVSSIYKKRNKKYQMEAQLINMELYALRSKLNPHFIFNTFNSIQLYINNNQTELSEKYLILLSKHIRNVFESSHLQNISLEKEISLLNDYLEIEKTRFGEKIHIEIKVDSALDLQNTYIPSMIIQPYVENSMVHGLFHKEGVGHLSVEFSFIDQYSYQVKIVDDGIGFIQKESERISSTKVTNERVSLINQAGDFSIRIEKSYLNPDKTDKGTVITIFIKNEQQD